MTGPWLFDGPPAPLPWSRAGGALPAAVLFDRDGTLVADVPYNGDPARVEPMPAARDAVEAVRALGIPVGIVSNQSGVARGLLTYRQVEAVRRRVDDLLGPFAVWAICPHGPDDGCDCRKPAPGLVLAACDRLGVPTERTTVIGDIGTDMTAAHAVGARGVLVPTPVTRPEEIEAAELTACDLLAAVRLVLGPGPDGPDPVRRAGVVPRRPGAADPAERANSAHRAADGPGSGHGADGVRRTETPDADDTRPPGGRRVGDQRRQASAHTTTAEVAPPAQGLTRLTYCLAEGLVLRRTAAVAPVGGAGRGTVDPAVVVRACWAADVYEREADGVCRAETGPGRASATFPGDGMYPAGAEHAASCAVGRTAKEAS